MLHVRSTLVLPPVSSDLVRGIEGAVTIDGVSPAFARGHLQSIPLGAVAAEIRGVVDDPARRVQVAASSYRHANGFYKVPLHQSPSGLRVRLHYWPAAEEAEENLHNHRWRMASRVLVGRLESEQWEPSTDGQALDWYEYRKEAVGSLEAERRLLGRATVRRTSAMSHFAGAAYAMDESQLHRIVKRDPSPTVTLMVQSAPVRPQNWMLARSIEPDVVPRPLDPDALARLLGEVETLLRAEAR
jgi:hypothetical protein